MLECIAIKRVNFTLYAVVPLHLSGDSDVAKGKNNSSLKTTITNVQEHPDWMW